MIWELDALKILARNETVPGVALRDAISEIDRLNKKLAKRGDKLAEQKIEAASDLLEAISLWFYKRQGMEEPNWTEQYKSVCRLFEPEEMKS